VMACGESQRIAPLGGPLSTASKIRGAAGCVTDDFVRDTRTILDLPFPVFPGGIAPLDSKGRWRDSGGRRSSPLWRSPRRAGDLVFGDADGIVVVPRRLEAQVLRSAFDKANSETSTTKALQQGQSLAEVFARRVQQGDAGPGRPRRRPGRHRHRSGAAQLIS
jgi:regulator of RNase E activity RraA